MADRFWAKVDKSGDCWVWTKTTDRDGYGRITTPGGAHGCQHRANRVSWELHFGPIPDGMHVLHTCDNPPCVRPTHLFLGTAEENLKDMTTKGRRWRGGSRKRVIEDAQG